MVLFWILCLPLLGHYSGGCKMMICLVGCSTFAECPEFIWNEIGPYIRYSSAWFPIFSKYDLATFYKVVCWQAFKFLKYSTFSVLITMLRKRLLFRVKLSVSTISHVLPTISCGIILFLDWGYLDSMHVEDHFMCHPCLQSCWVSISIFMPAASSSICPYYCHGDALIFQLQLCQYYNLITIHCHSTSHC